MKTITIVMATYNGGKYIKEQLDSIVPYMESSDELIISDDGSSDNTCYIIQEYIKQNPNIQLIEGPQKGVVKNFENALRLAKNDIVLFSDQDDVWLPEKIPTIRKIFEENLNIEVIHHDKYICSNEQLAKGIYEESDRPYKKWKHGVIFNLLFSCYYGCCMAMTRELVDRIIPFSHHTVAYDQLIGAIAERNGTSLFVEQPLIYRRVHGENMSQKRPVFEKIKFRIMCIKAYLDTLNKHNFK